MKQQQHPNVSYPTVSFAQASGPFPNQSRDDFHDRDEWSTGTRDDEAFLGGANGASTTRLSPAVAARERYMARKEANGNPYYYADASAAGAGAGAAAGRGCFAGKRKWWWVAGGVIVLAAIIAGVVAGVLLNKHSSSSSNAGVTGVVSSDAADPSVFTKDSNLHQSFYGMCYTPLNAQYPACGDTLDSVIEDIQLISQLTTRIRLYGSDCNVSSLVLDAIQQTKVNMTVFLATWLPQATDDPNNATYNRQVSEVQTAITSFGTDHVDGITVGNEVSEEEDVEEREKQEVLTIAVLLPVPTQWWNRGGVDREDGRHANDACWYEFDQDYPCWYSRCR
jgi:hypothetical protein